MSDAKFQQKRDMGLGIKFDQNKTEYHYLSPIALEKLCQVLTFGAKKYEAHNWRKGFKWSRLISACFRHLYAWMSGETYDKETGLSHLAHAMCCIMFLLEFEDTHKELDDRYSATQPPFVMKNVDEIIKSQSEAYSDISENKRLNDLYEREIKSGSFIKHKKTGIIHCVDKIVFDKYITTMGDIISKKDVDLYIFIE